MNQRNTYTKEVRDRAVKLVFNNKKEYESEWDAIKSIASKIGCAPQTLKKWVHQYDVDSGLSDGHSTSDKKRIKELESQVRELSQTNEILRKASAFFAQAELDRKPKKW